MLKNPPKNREQEHHRLESLGMRARARLGPLLTASGRAIHRLVTKKKKETSMKQHPLQTGGGNHTPGPSH